MSEVISPDSLHSEFKLNQSIFPFLHLVLLALLVLKAIVVLKYWDQ